jgi:AAA domain
MNKKIFANIMEFWRAVEALSPQQIPKVAPSDVKEPVHNWEHDTNPPWLEISFSRRPIQPSKAWRHSVYSAIYERPRFIERLEKIIGKPADVYEERPTGQSCVFSIAVDANGRPLVETFMISMAAWAFGVIESHGLVGLTDGSLSDVSGLHSPPENLGLPSSNSGFSGFDIFMDRLRNELAWRLGHWPEEQPVTQKWFDDFVNLVIARLKLSNLVEELPVQRIKSIQIRRPTNDAKNTKSKTNDDDFLNSFFIKDLNRILDDGLDRSGQGLRQYLEPLDGVTKLDVRQNRAQALKILSPQNVPQGCWPAEHPLVWSQQLAVNALWTELAEASGVFAVNGPPGTGKTTLLRDVVAAVVVERAKVLAKHGDSLLGVKRSINIGNRFIPYYDMNPALSGFSVVVASSNNGAVENVSLELPKQDAIYSVWAKEVNAYADLASELLQEPAWAMVAGKLGNKDNRSKFVNIFWWQKAGDDGKISGLRERLEDIKEQKAKPFISWDDAVEQFNKAIAAEQKCRAAVAQVANTLSLYANQLEELAVCEQQKEHSISNQTLLQERISHAQTELDRTDKNLTLINRRITTLRDLKPGFLEWLSSLGKSHRQWRQDLRPMLDEQSRQEEERSALEIQFEIVQKDKKLFEKHQSDLNAKLDALNKAIEKNAFQLSESKTKLGVYWPDILASDADQERSSPWMYPVWRESRIRVFVTAMNLHRAFVETNASKMIANLGLAMDMLGSGLSDDKLRLIALNSLALVCPVISTTFASVSSLFGELGADSIGWLLIDEAGQATPQAAAGAIWRAKRTVVVGDPLQLEPIVTVPRTIEAALATQYENVNLRWHPSLTSVQKLADQATPVGTSMGEEVDSLWVGAPLRVHRRCDEPMFSISNKVAYEGLMVHHKKQSKETWPTSAWIDVPQSLPNGNWIPAEGEALQILLANLLRNHSVPVANIFLISPFRDVVRELKRIGKINGLDNKNRVGTVHTTQGKESDVVILVLGGGTQGAKNWAASKPNLLNVAVSRAKGRLYVIGDREDWSRRRYFDVLNQLLV